MAKNRKVKSIYILAIFSVAVFSLLFLTEPVKADEYYKQGTLLSTNLLNGLEDVAIIESFDCTASVSASTTVYAKFSQDGTNWYNHDGYKGWWDSCADGTTNIDLTVLEWTTANFYYKLKFETEISTSTAIVSQVKVNYSDTYTPPTLTDYHKQGSLVSTNLLEGTKVNFFNGTEKFGYNITSLPAGTTVQAQFSQDAINWYSSTSTQWAWDTLSAGNHLDASSALDLSGLAWTENSFYYKLKFETTDSSETPILNEIKLLRRATVINAPITNYYTGGLVGYWTFNGQDMDWGSSTAEALDRSGNNNNGNVTNFGQEGAVIGKVGQALDFDGYDDYVDCGNKSSLNITDEFTLVAWIKLDSTSGDWQQIVSKRDSSSNTNYQLVVENQKVHVAYRTDTTWHAYATGNDLASASQWYHVVGRMKSATPSVAQVYIDGVAAGTGWSYGDGTGAIQTNTEQVRIGDDGEGHRFNGLIDEVRVYNRALSADEVMDLYQAGARKFQVNTPITQKYTGGLVGHWTFNGQDMDGVTAYDRSGQGNNGTLTNGPKATIGKVSQALEFDGVDDYVEMGTQPDLTGAGAATVSFWFNADVLSGQDYRHLVQGYYNNFQMFWHDTDDNLYCTYKLSGGNISATKNFTATKSWHHFVGTYDGNQAQIYVDTEAGTPENGTGNIASGGSLRLFQVGAQEGTAGWDGIIDEVRVYNRALSAEEIQELYRAGSRGATIKN